MPKHFSSINLVKDQKGDLVERIINWSLSVGRALVILTELIALVAFLWRFGLDQELVDLHTQIKQKQAIVSAFKPNEDRYRNLQDRLSIASNFSAINNQQTQTLRDILTLASGSVSFNKINLSGSSISVEINVGSVAALSDFVNSLKTYSNVETVSIDKIETKTSSAVIIVSITVKLKPVKNRYAIIAK